MTLTAVDAPSKVIEALAESAANISTNAESLYKQYKLQTNNPEKHTCEAKRGLLGKQVGSISFSADHSKKMQVRENLRMNKKAERTVDYTGAHRIKKRVTINDLS